LVYKNIAKYAILKYICMLKLKFDIKKWGSVCPFSYYNYRKSLDGYSPLTGCGKKRGFEDN